MQTVRGFYRQLERTSQGKPDWHFRIGVGGGCLVIFLLLILLITLL